ncbi:MAG TPA: polyprenyl synthetase family protein [Anaerolineae bacterium]
MNHAIELVKDKLQDVEQTLLHLPDIQPAELRHAVEVIVSSGGKRIRPTVSLLINAMCSSDASTGSIRKRSINLASAVEMLHTATLVHDDLIDGSLMRRGASTLNAVWTPAATVLTGDYLFAIAAGLAARTDSLRVMNIFADTLGVIVAGELRQQFTDWAKRSTREDYCTRIYAKTASMFVLAASAAGVVSECPEQQISQLAQYGQQFGLAFQIVDDILDFTGEQSSIGKPVGSDLRNGLITLPTICFAETHRDDKELACAFSGECDNATYDRLVQRIRDSSAINAAMDEAAQYIAQAKQALRTFAPSVYRDALIDLADYTISRDK